MGDEWPWAPPRYATWQQAYDALILGGADTSLAATLAAIATAESGIDQTVLNNTPATGDYSVGPWQINYYGNLLASRTAAYGTPEDLALASLDYQASVAIKLERGSGLQAWSTYKSGAYLAYMHGYTPSPGLATIGTIAEEVAGVVSTYAFDWSPGIRVAADAHQRTGGNFNYAAIILDSLR